MTIKFTILIKKVVLATLVAGLLSFGFINITKAQEINPAPGTYVYGSSSEFSPYATLGQSATPGTLAPTGQSQTLPIIIILAVTSIATLLILAAYKMQKHT